MKIATTIGEVYGYAKSPVEAVRFYEGTGFKHLDYSFYNILNPDHPTYMMMDAWQDQILEVKDAAAQLGFDFVQAHAPCCELRGEGMEAGLAATIRSIEACGMLGIKNMVIHSGCWADFKYPDGQEGNHKANEPFMRALIPAMEKHDVRILFENSTMKHTGGGNYFPIYGKDLNAFVDFMDHPLFGACWDVGHAHMDGIDHQKEINDMGKNLLAIHVHDNDGRKDFHTVPFCGSLDFDSLMRGLIDIDYKGYFTLEVDGFFKFNRLKVEGDKLKRPPAELKKEALKLQYKLTKYMLESYGLYEE